MASVHCAHVKHVSCTMVAHYCVPGTQCYRRGENSVRGFFRRGKFRTGNIPHLSQKSRGKFRTSQILSALQTKGILVLRSPKDTICVCLVSILFLRRRTQIEQDWVLLKKNVKWDMYYARALRFAIKSAGIAFGTTPNARRFFK